LTHDLDPAARRRLWIVGRFVERCGLSEIDAVLSVAAKVEAFIVTGATSDADGAAKHGVTACTGDESTDLEIYRPAFSQAQLATTISTGLRSSASPGSKGNVAQRPLLDQEAKARFIQEAARNPDNRHLAQTFGLSIRQAHAIRVGVSKYIASARREYEQQMQDDPLRTKAKSGSTMDDVVRYLREIDDVVVPDGRHYVVNSNLTLTAEQLVERANRKRREHNLQPLVMEDTDAPCEAISD
jgi:hypothetical protein